MNDTSNSEWYYLDPSRKPVGPISFDDLRLLCQKGALGPTSKIWKKSFGQEWKNASEVSGLFDGVNFQSPQADLGGQGEGAARRPSGPDYREVESKYGYSQKEMPSGGAGEGVFRGFIVPFKSMAMMKWLITFFVGLLLLLVAAGLGKSGGEAVLVVSVILMTVALLGMSVVIFMICLNFFKMLSNDREVTIWKPGLLVLMIFVFPFLLVLLGVGLMYLTASTSSTGAGFLWLIFSIGGFLIALYPYYLLAFKGKISYDRMRENLGVRNKMEYPKTLFTVAFILNCLSIVPVVTYVAGIVNLVSYVFMSNVLRDLKDFEEQAGPH